MNRAKLPRRLRPWLRLPRGRSPRTTVQRVSLVNNRLQTFAKRVSFPIQPATFTNVVNLHERTSWPVRGMSHSQGGDEARPSRWVVELRLGRPRRVKVKTPRGTSTTSTPSHPARASVAVQREVLGKSLASSVRKGEVRPSSTPFAARAFSARAAVGKRDGPPTCFRLRVANLVARASSAPAEEPPVPSNLGSTERASFGRGLSPCRGVRRIVEVHLSAPSAALRASSVMLRLASGQTVRLLARCRSGGSLFGRSAALLDVPHPSCVPLRDDRLDVVGEPRRRPRPRIRSGMRQIENPLLFQGLGC